MNSSPKEKYLYDNRYHTVVDTIESHLHACTFSQEEMREIVLLACFHYEINKAKELRKKAYLPVQPYPINVLEALETLQEWREKRPKP